MISLEAATIILARIQAADRRTVGETDIRHWAETLDHDVTAADGCEAVANHYRYSDGWITPALVNALTAAIRSRRRRIDRAARSCRRAGCYCDHTTCYRGWADQPVTDRDGYEAIKPCPTCLISNRCACKQQAGWHDITVGTCTPA